MILGNLLFLNGLGMWEMILIFAVIMLLFGAKKIPELARGLGRGIREFKDASREIKSEIENGGREEDSKKEASSNDSKKEIKS